MFLTDVVSKYLFTDVVESKKPEIIKASLLKIFKKIDSMQQHQPSHVHLKRFCAGIILILLSLQLLILLLLLDYGGEFSNKILSEFFRKNKATFNVLGGIKIYLGLITL